MHSKIIGCNIHGPINISPMALKIIDTPEFQRLKNIKQLGVSSYVFPSATHTRFEHSIGVYHLSQLLTDKLSNKYPDIIFDNPELGQIKLDKLICECIGIASLSHDLGHGPFSHLMEDIMHSMTDNENANHEIRSCKIIEMICKRELGDVLTDNHIRFIQSLINPQERHVGALYQIVANKKNNIDIDKIDYLARDTYALGLNKGSDFKRIIENIIIDEDGNIAYSKHVSIEIYELFNLRYVMHKKIYSHKTSKIIELMISDIIKMVEPIFKITDMINDMNDFCRLTDNTIFFWLENSMMSSYHLGKKLDDNEMLIIRDAYNLYQNLIKRKLYKLVAEISDDDCVYFNEFIKYLVLKDIDVSSLKIISINIGFVSCHDKNPFDSLCFYDSKGDKSKSFFMNKNQISNLLGNNYTENHHFLICKDRNIYGEILELYDGYK
jgi:deoxynucleoside triphosphate triphosphohydrolase SAMHD1